MVKGLAKKDFCSLCLTEKFWLIKYLETLTCLIKNQG